jgi:hypothetical protein
MEKVIWVIRYLVRSQNRNRHCLTSRLYPIPNLNQYLQ